MNNDFEINPILNLNALKKNRIISKIDPKKSIINYRKFYIIIIFLFSFLLIISFILYNIIFRKINKNNNFESSYLNQSSYQQDDLTLVTAYYRMKSKHTPEEYIKWNQKFCFIK